MTGEDRLCTPGRRCGVARGGRGQRGEVRRLTARRRRRRIPLAARPPPLTAATISLDFVRYASPLARATRCVESVIDSPPPSPRDGDTIRRRRGQCSRGYRQPRDRPHPHANQSRDPDDSVRNTVVVGFKCSEIYQCKTKWLCSRKAVC